MRKIIECGVPVVAYERLQGEWFLHTGRVSGHRHVELARIRVTDYAIDLDNPEPFKPSIWADFRNVYTLDDLNGDSLSLPFDLKLKLEYSGKLEMEATELAKLREELEKLERKVAEEKRLSSSL